MKDICAVTDFDGTVTEKDTLYSFFETYAEDKWKEVEQDWVKGKISSKECLIQEFNLVPDLSDSLIKEFLKSINIDKYFKDFYKLVKQENIDLYIVSDGVDYFIESILKKYNLADINIISNHGEFDGEKFILTFPNDNPYCVKDSGTCKCSIINSLKNNYKKVIYIGDGVSDYCVADKADTLFAKKRLLEYCRKNMINHIPYNDFSDICNIFTQQQ